MTTPSELIKVGQKDLDGVILKKQTILSGFFDAKMKGQYGNLVAFWLKQPPRHPKPWFSCAISAPCPG